MAADTLGQVDVSTQVLLRQHSKELIVADNDTLSSFPLSSTGQIGTRNWKARVPGGKIIFVGDVSSGVIIAWTKKKSTLISLVQSGHLSTVFTFPSVIFALATSQSDVFVVVAEPKSITGRLLRLDISKQCVLKERHIPSTNVDLQLEPGGKWLTITYRSKGFVCTVPATLDAWPVSTTSCHHCTPENQCDNCRHSPGSSQIPGSAGCPADNGGTVVCRGGSIGKQNQSQGGPISCWVDLLWPAFRLFRTSEFAIAVDNRKKNLAVIKLEPLTVVTESQFGKSGFLVAIDAHAPNILILNLNTPTIAGVSTIQSTNLLSLTSLGKPLTLAAKISPEVATFIGANGLQTYSLMAGSAPPTGPLNILVLPIIEGNQIWSSTNNAGIAPWAAFLDRTLVPVVESYYNENSYGMLTNISFKYFGRDVGPVGGPLQLPMPFLKDYFNPLYSPAELILTQTPVTPIVFDGRETMQLNIQPDGGGASTTLNLTFGALLFRATVVSYPLTIQYSPTDTLNLQVNGLTLKVNFAFSVTIQNSGDTSSLNALVSQIDSSISSAEKIAGVTNSRLFAPPLSPRIIPSPTGDQLTIIVPASSTTGPKLAVSASANVAGDDPLGLNSALGGSMDPTTSTGLANLNTYLNILLNSANYDTSSNTTGTLVASVNGQTLTTTIPVSKSVGGPTAAISLVSSTFLDQLFSTSTMSANSNSTSDTGGTVLDSDAYNLLQDALTAAVNLLNPTDVSTVLVNAGWNVVILFPVDAAPTSVLAQEMWTVTPMTQVTGLRGFETVATISTGTIQLQTAWSLSFFNNGEPDIGTVCHELGHGIGFRDLYHIQGYRQDLAYLNDWAMMGLDRHMPHHVGYHKMQAGWITPDRVYSIPPSSGGVTTTTYILLVPVEVQWNADFPTDARSAFSEADSDTPVVQLVQLDLGGDGAVYDLIEAHQKGTYFSQSISPGIIITNALQPYDDKLYAFEGNYRRELQLLNPNNILSNAGDTFDLANAHGLPATGITVTLVELQTVNSATVFYIQVTRTNSNYIDLYFSSSDPIYENPDLYVVNNENDISVYPLGQPTNQGEPILVPASGAADETNYIVARVRNSGQIEADQVKVVFSVCFPPGGGDTGDNYTPVASTLIPTVPGGSQPEYAYVQLPVPSGFNTSFSLAADIADWQIPTRVDGAALASDDVWLANNNAIKNVTEFVPLPISTTQNFRTFMSQSDTKSTTYEPTEFEYSVHSNSKYPQYAYLEPDGLPYGMTLTVIPRFQIVPPKSTVIFNCLLELDHTIVDAGCHSDRQFRLVTWRQEPESSSRWGGVRYKVMPRKRCTITLSGTWTDSNEISLQGRLIPNPGATTVQIRIQFSDVAPSWVTVTPATGGWFSWSGKPIRDRTMMNAYAQFSGNKVYGPAQSPLVKLHAQPVDDRPS